MNTPGSWADDPDGYGEFYYVPRLTVAEVADALNWHRRKVALLVEQMVVRPADEEPGKGRNRMFTYAQFALFILCTKLEQLGIKPAKMSVIVDLVHDEMLKRLSQGASRSDDCVLIIHPEAGGNPPRVIVEGSEDEAEDDVMRLTVGLSNLEFSAIQLHRSGLQKKMAEQKERTDARLRGQIEELEARLKARMDAESENG